MHGGSDRPPAPASSEAEEALDARRSGPGRRPISRTASSTPGMNETRSYESCRRVSVSPAAPSSTSWCATSPVSRTACTGTPSTSAPRAPGSAVGRRVRRRAGRPAARAGRGDQPARCGPRCRSARRPCSGGAARRSRPTGRTGPPPAANRISSTAPMPKLGAMTTPTSGFGLQPLGDRWRAAASSKPVVPTTQWMSWSMQKRMLSMTTSGRVKSTTTWAPASATSNSQSPVVDHRDQLEVLGGVDRPARPRCPSGRGRRARRR